MLQRNFAFAPIQQKEECVHSAYPSLIGVRHIKSSGNWREKPCVPFPKQLKYILELVSHAGEQHDTALEYSQSFIYLFIYIITQWDYLLLVTSQIKVLQCIYSLFFLEFFK